MREVTPRGICFWSNFLEGSSRLLANILLRGTIPLLALYPPGVPGIGLEAPGVPF